MSSPKLSYQWPIIPSSISCSTGSSSQASWVGGKEGVESPTDSLDVLLLVPPLSQAAISNHLNENYSTTTHPRARINLKQHDEYEDEDDEGDAMNQGLLVERDGTARLLKRFRRLITVSLVSISVQGRF